MQLALRAGYVAKLSIIPGRDTFVIVYDWHKTADEIRTRCTEAGAFQDADGVRIWFVTWDGMGRPPMVAGLDHVCFLNNDWLDFMVEVVHETLRERAH